MIDEKTIYLYQYFDTVLPKEFYRTIFPEGELQKKGVSNDHKYNAIAVELLADKEKGHNTRRYTINDDLDMIDELLMHNDFILLSPISYIGKNRTSENARLIYAIVIDLDGVKTAANMQDLFYQMEGNGPSGFLPKPTFVVNSGNGLHLYYVFKEPVPCFKNITDQMAKMKYNLTKKIWNGYVTDLSENVQYQSVFQGFRLVGGVTKKGQRTIAYETGEKVTLEYLNEFVEVKNQVTQFAYKTNLTLAEARKKYPDWYDRRIVRGEKKRCWLIKRDLYEWWKKKIEIEVVEGHRYYAMMCLAVYAKKCKYHNVKNKTGVTYAELEKDAFALVAHFDKLTSTDDNHFTRADVLDALELYNDDYVTFPIETISQLTGLDIKKNKRNGRNKYDHLKRARAVQDVDYPDGEWRNKDGRPNKKSIVQDYMKAHPGVRKVDVINATGLSKPTVYKYYDEINLESENTK